jgi:hypothetical protein
MMTVNHYGLAGLKWRARIDGRELAGLDWQAWIDGRGLMGLN